MLPFELILCGGTAFDSAVTVALNNNIPASYKLTDANDGDQMFDFFKQYKNVWFILSGHQTHGSTQVAVGRRIDRGTNGNIILQIYANYENHYGGGDGYLRSMTFHPSTNTVDVTTYSPYLAQYLMDADDQFTIPMNESAIIPTGGEGTIAGRIKDASSCSVLSGATVAWQGGSTTTDKYGNYVLKNVTPGTWQVQVKAVGYQTSTLNVQVDDGLASSSKQFLTVGVDAAPPPPPTGTPLPPCGYNCTTPLISPALLPSM